MQSLPAKAVIDELKSLQIVRDEHVGRLHVPVYQIGAVEAGQGGKKLFAPR